MKILLYSHSFYPAVGGVETVSFTLAKELCNRDIKCKVVTTTAENGSISLPFEVIRNPGRMHQIKLIKWADVVLFNGASLALQPWILLYRKPFIWVHVGYQVSCIDGLGWVAGKHAPLEPFSSIIHHIQLKGLRLGITEGIKLLIRRFFAKYLVTKNVAITEWMKKKQPLPRQVHIYNPFPLDKFFKSNSVQPEYDFLYLGRIVSEKGISTLLKALAKVNNEFGYTARLLIIGEGDCRKQMEELASDLKILEKVTFAGQKSGDNLIEWVAKARIAVVPSEWYEPMGGVALELMAAGKNLIVSEQGGLKECVGDVGLSFPNGDGAALAKCMIRLLEDKSLRNSLLEKSQERVTEFLPAIFVSEYIELLREVSKVSGGYSSFSG